MTRRSPAAAERRLEAATREPVARRAAQKLETPAYAQQETMKAVVWKEPEVVRVEDRPRPTLGSAGDVIVRVTRAALCGSDLHLYHGSVPEMGDGDIIGHEFVGVVEEVGPAVDTLHEGDRVAVSALIACGECWFCREKLFSLCDTTNQNPAVAALYGQSLSAVFGYSHLTGGIPGGHAEYVRVPYADVNCLKLPDDVTDEQVVSLGDTWCTGWMAADYAGAGPGTTIAVWGLGPIGLLALASARVMGAEHLIGIDNVPERLDLAKRHLGADVVNYDEEQPVTEVLSLTNSRGPDGAIDATGFRYAKSLRHKAQRAVKLETDAIDALTEAMMAVRKAGTVVPIGDFIGFANQFHIGAFMEKGLTMRSSQIHVQRYWDDVLSHIRSGEYDPTFTITHRYPLEQAPEAYQKFDKKEDGCIKVVFET